MGMALPWRSAPRRIERLNEAWRRLTSAMLAPSKSHSLSTLSLSRQPLMSARRNTTFSKTAPERSAPARSLPERSISEMTSPPRTMSMSSCLSTALLYAGVDSRLTGAFTGLLRRDTDVLHVRVREARPVIADRPEQVGPEEVGALEVGPGKLGLH